MNRSADTLLAAILLWMVSLLAATVLMIVYDVFTPASLVVASLSTGIPATVLAVSYLASRVNARPESALEALALAGLQTLGTAATLQLLFSLVPEIITDPVWSGAKVLLYRSSVAALLVTVSAALFAARRREREAQVD
ncbi:MAG: hypothetical protein D6724_05890 [Armatimonadetes bacterium]|nr:MAG: hypothetical protein D6724_05890 [Armatimonadota bacterium]